MKMFNGNGETDRIASSKKIVQSRNKRKRALHDYGRGQGTTMAAWQIGERRAATAQQCRSLAITHV